MTGSQYRDLRTGADSRSGGPSGVRWRRRVRRIGAVLFLLVGALVTAHLLLITMPASDEPAAADAIVVLGPATEERLDVADELLAAGYATELVIASPHPDLEPRRVPDPCIRPDAHTTCFVPAPYTTLGEIDWIERRMADQGWERVLILTHTPHVTRTSWFVDACLDGDALVVGTSRGLDGGDWAFQFVYQAGAVVKAWWYGAQGRFCTAPGPEQVPNGEPDPFAVER